jgi:hypothetical protein
MEACNSFWDCSASSFNSCWVLMLSSRIFKSSCALLRVCSIFFHAFSSSAFKSEMRLRKSCASFEAS